MSEGQPARSRGAGKGTGVCSVASSALAIPYGPGYSGPGHARPDWAGPDWAGPDCAGPDWAGPDWAGQAPCLAATSLCQRGSRFTREVPSNRWLPKRLPSKWV